MLHLQQGHFPHHIAFLLCVPAAFSEGRDKGVVVNLDRHMMACPSGPHESAMTLAMTNIW